MRIFLHLLSVTDFGAYGKHLSRLLSNCLAHMIISRHRQWKSSFSRSVKYGFIFILGGSLFYYYFTASQFDHSYSKDLSETKMTKLGVGHFTSISGHFSANYIKIFHKTEVQTVTLRCFES